MLLNWIADLVSLHYKAAKVELSEESEWAWVELKFAWWPCLRNRPVFYISGQLSAGLLHQALCHWETVRKPCCIWQSGIPIRVKVCDYFKVTVFYGECCGKSPRVKDEHVNYQSKLWLLVSSFQYFSVCVVCLDTYNHNRKYLVLQTDRHVEWDSIFLKGQVNIGYNL